MKVTPLTSVTSHSPKWNSGVDEYIPTALELARSRVVGSLVGKGHEILDQAVRAIMRRFPVLRHSINTEMLSKRIDELNKTRDKASSKYIWIDRPPAGIAVPPITDTSPEAEATRQLIEGRKLVELEETYVEDVIDNKPIVVPPPQPKKPSINDQPVVSVSSAIAGMFNNLADAINKMANNQVELLASQQLLMEQVQQLNQGVQTLSQAILLLSENVLHKCVEETPVVKPDVPPPEVVPQETETTEVVHTSNNRVPTMPPKKGNIVVVTRDQICFGQSWDKVCSRPLTTAESNWQKLLAFKKRKWEQQGIVPTGVPTSVVVFGWDASLSEAQNVFYRLGFGAIVWYCTYNLTGSAATHLAEKVTHSDGQVVLLVNKNSAKVTLDDKDLERDRAWMEAITARCRVLSLPWWRHFSDRLSGIDTNSAAEHLVTKCFRGEWELMHDKAGLIK